MLILLLYILYGSIKKLIFHVGEVRMEFILSTFLLRDAQLWFFFTITMTIASCWVAPRWVSYLGYVLSCSLAYRYHYAEVLGFSYLLLIFLGLLAYQKVSFISKKMLGILLTMLIFSIYLHALPGFHNFKIIDQVKLSPDSNFYSAYVSVDKIMVGSLLLLFYCALNKSITEWKKSLRSLPFPLLYVCALLLGTAFAMHSIKIDLKIPSILIWWLPTNLLLVCAMEEIFYRGFIQKELTKFFASYKNKNWIALSIAAFIFGISHYRGGVPYIILSTLAGIGHGYVFMRSQRLESSILLHFSVNLIHILGFSYPSLLRG